MAETPQVDPNDAQAVSIIADALPFLAHPDGKTPPMRLAGVVQTGKPKGVRDAASRNATRAAEGIIHALKSAGGRVDFGPAPEAPPEPIDDSQPRVIEVYCGLCSNAKPLLSLTLRNPATNNRINISGPALLAGLASLPTECPHMTAPDISNVAEVAAAHQVVTR